ncbi:hypothetical protein PF010_g1717 [Phytophthora fragariae]|uniref:DDE Tnp4 domain-containing protein n=1 Tax=Phytophthora fragariae TaxID=53985 RepID=A0A6G0LZH4_9STRA|nr:hypothetical protein PF003_g22345 [Phytophthora fragariae]KAE9136372.1 hypothetical protein PF010_g1717 [Phytophthora fragariae]
MHPSDVKKLKRGVTAAIFQLAMAQQLQEASRVGHDEGDTAEDDVLPDLVNLRHALNSVRYSVPRKNVVRSTAHQRLLYTLGDAEFRTFTRVSKNTFNVLLDLIRRRGLPAEAQQHEKTSTRRGSTTCRDAGMRFGLVEGEVSFVDRTHVILDQKPHINGALHYNRKCRYSFNVQIVCNEDKVILHAFTGWPGSCCDSTVFSKTPLAQHPERFFSGDQYLIGVTPRLITPYKLPAALKAETAFYNEGIRTQINRKKDFRHVNNHILACVMLHNLGIALFDEWDDAALDDEDDDDINSGSGGKTAKEKRERIKVVLLRM